MSSTSDKKSNKSLAARRESLLVKKMNAKKKGKESSSAANENETKDARVPGNSGSENPCLDESLVDVGDMDSHVQMDPFNEGPQIVQTQQTQQDLALQDQLVQENYHDVASTFEYDDGMDSGDDNEMISHQEYEQTNQHRTGGDHLDEFSEIVPQYAGEAYYDDDEEPEPMSHQYQQQQEYNDDDNDPSQVYERYSDGDDTDLLHEAQGAHGEGDPHANDNALAWIATGDSTEDFNYFDNHDHNNENEPGAQFTQHHEVNQDFGGDGALMDDDYDQIDDQIDDQVDSHFESRVENERDQVDDQVDDDDHNSDDDHLYVEHAEYPETTALYPHHSSATIVPDPELINKPAPPKQVTHADKEWLQGFHSSDAFENEPLGGGQGGDEGEAEEVQVMSVEEQLKAKLRAEKQKSKEASERERSRKEVEYAALLAQEEQQREERWRAKETARLARQRAKEQAEEEASKVMAERIARRKEEQEKLVQQEDDSFVELMRLRGDKPTPQQQPSSSSSSSAFNNARLTVDTSHLPGSRAAQPKQENQAMVTPTARTGTSAADAKSALANLFNNRSSIWDRDSDETPTPTFTPGIEHELERQHMYSIKLKQAGASKEVAKFSPYQQSKHIPSGIAAPVAVSALISPRSASTESRISFNTGSSSQPPPSHLQQLHAHPSFAGPLDHNNHPMSVSRSTSIQGRCPYLLSGTPVVGDPLTGSSRNFTNSQLRLLVRTLRIPSPPLARRLGLWAFTEGFILTPPADFDASEFKQGCLDAAAAAAGARPDGVLTDLASITLAHHVDWNALIDTLRDFEKDHENDDNSDALAAVGGLVLVADLYLIPKPIQGMAAPATKSGPATGAKLADIPPLSKLVCEGLLLDTSDDTESLTKKICGAIPAFVESDVRPLLDELYISKSSPLVAGWEKLKKHLTNAEEIILYQEFTIDELRRQVQALEHKLGSIEDSFALDGSRFGAPSPPITTIGRHSTKLRQMKRLVATADRNSNNNKENKEGTLTSGSREMDVDKDKEKAFKDLNNVSLISMSGSIDLMDTSASTIATTNTNANVNNRSEWRSYVDDKQRMIRAHNQEKADLLLEIQRLRRLMDPGQVDQLKHTQSMQQAHTQLQEYSIDAQIRIDTLTKQLQTARRELSTKSASAELSAEVWRGQFKSLLLRAVKGPPLTQAEYAAAKTFATTGPTVNVHDPAVSSTSNPSNASSSSTTTNSSVGDISSKYPTLSAPIRYPSRQPPPSPSSSSQQFQRQPSQSSYSQSSHAQPSHPQSSYQQQTQLQQAHQQLQSYVHSYAPPAANDDTLHYPHSLLTKSSSSSSSQFRNDSSNKPTNPTVSSVPRSSGYNPAGVIDSFSNPSSSTMGSNYYGSSGGSGSGSGMTSYSSILETNTNNTFVGDHDQKNTNYPWAAQPQQSYYNISGSGNSGNNNSVMQTQYSRMNMSQAQPISNSSSNSSSFYSQPSLLSSGLPTTSYGSNINNYNYNYNQSNNFNSNNNSVNNSDRLVAGGAVSEMMSKRTLLSPR